MDALRTGFKEHSNARGDWGISALFLAGTARCAVRAAFSGATNVVERLTVPHCGIPPALRGR
ncbi:MAG TPA: hypothetical protein VGJ73_13590 [Verrucomicrobiae bacterium]